jgi:hypothetical protein
MSLSLTDFNLAFGFFEMVRAQTSINKFWSAKSEHQTHSLCILSIASLVIK